MRTTRSRACRMTRSWPLTHEAGHAVTTVMMRRSLRKATIVPEEDSGGHVLHGPLSKGFSSRLEEASYQGPGESWTPA